MEAVTEIGAGRNAATPTEPDSGERPGRRPVPRWLRALIPAVLVLSWLVVAGLGGPAFGQIQDVSSNDRALQLPASAEATVAQKLEDGFRSTGVIPAVLVYERPGGLSGADRQAIESDVRAVKELAGVEADSVSPAIASDDGEAAQIIVPIETAGESEASDTVAEIRSYLADNTRDGLSVFVTGPAGQTADLIDAFAGIDGLLLLVALTAVFVILIIVYRSPMLPFIVLGTSVFALTAAVLVVVALAKSGALLLSGQTQGILFILVIGAATDYSLLYVARYREALRDHSKRWDATWVALRGSFEPILASGGTVIAALLILLLSDLGSNKSLGPVAAIGIVFALLAALTLLPAIMLAAGRAAFWPLRPVFGSPHPDLDGDRPRKLWPWVGRLIAGQPRLIWSVTALVLVVASLGLLTLKADGVAQSEFVLGPSQARDGQAVVSDHFPGGSGTPAVIVGPESKLGQMADIILSNHSVASVSVASSDSPSGSLPITADGIILPLQPSGAPTGSPTVVDGNVLLRATLEGAGDSQAAEQTVIQLRDKLDSVGGDQQVLVGGTAAVAIDSDAAAIRDRSLIIPLVLMAILLILMVLLRSVVAPVLLVASVVLSFGAALGVSSQVFNEILGFPGADPTVPLFGFVFLVALGVDYNIFLMTRVREESVRHGTRLGIVRGLASTGGVITSAGLVLAATFAALGVLPILFLAQISFIVAFGVLLDTFIVRSLLVPALSYDIGRAIWWPSRLSRARR